MIEPTNDYVRDEFGFQDRELFYGYDVITGVIEYTDDGVAIEIGRIPRGSILLPPIVNVAVAFDDTGTDLLDVGISGTGDAYIANLDVSTTGQKLTSGVVTAFDGTPLEEDVVITAQYDGSNSDAGAGKLLLIFPFLRT